MYFYQSKTITSSFFLHTGGQRKRRRSLLLVGHKPDRRLRTQEKLKSFFSTTLELRQWLMNSSRLSLRHFLKKKKKIKFPLFI